MKRKSKKQKIIEPLKINETNDLLGVTKMTKKFSYYGCLIRIKGRVVGTQAPEWLDIETYAAVKLDSVFYNGPGVSQITSMFPVEAIKREDPNSYFIVEYQSSDAIKKQFIHKLNITLIPQNPANVDPQYGSNYKTTLVVSGALELKDYIPNHLSPFIWQLGPNSIPYISKPGSISPLGGRKNKEQFS